jgi:ribulose-phosphate 3-epimerase
MAKINLAASLVCANPINLEADLKKLVEAKVDYLHFDVMDNQFVPRLGMYPEILAKITEKYQIPTEVHLMTANPENLIASFAAAGANIISFHPESTPHPHRVMALIRQAGVKAGVVLNPGTPLSVLDYLIDDLELVMLMGINPGILNHPFIPSTLNKLKKLSKNKLRPKLLGVDGGVNFETANKLVKNGANYLVCGSQTIFKGRTKISEQTKLLRQLLPKKGA